MNRTILRSIETACILIALASLGYAYVHVWYGPGMEGDVRGPFADERYWRLGDVDGYLQNEFVQEIERNRNLDNLIRDLETAHHGVREPAMYQARTPERKEQFRKEYAFQEQQVKKIVEELQRLSQAQKSAQEVTAEDIIGDATEDGVTVSAGDVEARTEPVEDLGPLGE